MTKRKLTIDDFRITDLDPDGDIYYNFNPNDKLKPSVGVDTIYVDYLANHFFYMPVGVTHVKALLHFVQYLQANNQDVHRLLIYCDDKKLYTHQMFITNTRFYYLYNLTFESVPYTIHYRYNDQDGAIFADGTKMVVWKGSTTPYAIENVPVISSMCVNNGTLFCSVVYPHYKVWYNKDIDLEKVGDQDSVSGYIDLNDDLGGARKVIDFNEFVFVFRDYGITKISNYKDEITVNNIYETSTKIFANTVSVCGDVVIFLTADGVYSFNGTKVTKVDINITKILSSLENATVTSLKNYYYLGLKLDFDDGKTVVCEEDDCVNNAILVINVEDYSFQVVRGVDASHLEGVLAKDFEKVTANFNTGDNKGTVGQIVEESRNYDEILPKYWRKKALFEDFNNKIITKFSVQCASGIDFTLNFDGVIKNLTSTKDGLNEFYLKRKCQNLGLEISSSELSAYVDKLEITYYDC